MEDVLSIPQSRTLVDLKDYGHEMVTKMAEAWETAQQCVSQAQKKQKQQRQEAPVFQRRRYSASRL